MPLNSRQLRLVSDIVRQVTSGKATPRMGLNAFSKNPEAQQAFIQTLGLVAPEGFDLFSRAPVPPGALAKVGGYGRYEVPSMGEPAPGTVFGAGPRFLPQPRIFERPTAIVPSPGGAVDYPGYVRRTAQELLSERLGALPGGQTTFGVATRGVGEDMPGVGFPSRPNISQGVRVDTGIPQSAFGRSPAGYSYTDLGAGIPGALTVRPTVVTGGTPPPPFYGGSRTEYMYPGGALARTQDLRVNPVDVRDITDTIVREATENAISGGVRTGNIGSILRNAGIAAGAGLGGYLLTRLLGIGSPSESVAPGQINQPGAGAVPPGTVAPTTPPSMIPGPDQRTGGVESAPASPAPGSIAGQVVIQSPGDINESLREQMQQYAGVREPSKLPPSAIPKDKQLAAGYAEQEAFGRANMDSIVNELGLTGNLEIWARSNPLSAAQLYLRTAAKQRQATDLNQRTEFTAPQEIQPRGLSQQSPAVQGQMVNSQLGSDFLRNRTGNINLSTQAGMAPTQGAYDLRDSTAPLAQPTLINPDAYAQQDEARREQMRQFIFESAAAGLGFA